MRSPDGESLPELGPLTPKIRPPNREVLVVGRGRPARRPAAQTVVCRRAAPRNRSIPSHDLSPAEGRIRRAHVCRFPSGKSAPGRHRGRASAEKSPNIRRQARPEAPPGSTSASSVKATQGIASPSFRASPCRASVPARGDEGSAPAGGRDQSAVVVLKVVPEGVLEVVVLQDALVTHPGDRQRQALRLQVGTHRRLALTDVLAYQGLSSSRPRDALERMTRQAEGVGPLRLTAHDLEQVSRRETCKYVRAGSGLLRARGRASRQVLPGGAAGTRGAVRTVVQEVARRQEALVCGYQGVGIAAIARGACPHAGGRLS